VQHRGCGRAVVRAGGHGSSRGQGRNFSFYVNDDGDLTGVRFDNWKMVFLEQRVVGTMAVWAIKGASHLCADSYRLRYRPAARRPQMIDTGMSHIGFRCAAARAAPSTLRERALGGLGGRGPAAPGTGEAETRTAIYRSEL
jgi:hypothetical protein